ncbi:MAG: GTPase HflX, partial [Planctomycetes bacterium]|nr:GTPase HflX [Planctomycetota bacterium]
KFITMNGITIRFYIFGGIFRLENTRETLTVGKERAILMGAIIKGHDDGDNLEELTALAETAGAIIVDRFQQKISTPHPVRYIGKGKAELLAERVVKYDADVVIFDNDLSPRQIRELEKIIEAKVIDRSELILDIFASRARTAQAKLQVDLAQLEYTYPRLTRMWSHLDSVVGAAGGTVAGAVGGIGTRGTGEKQLEIDRRLVNKRVTELKARLAKIDKRKIREISGRGSVFKACLVGYTNAGKSTVLNALTGAGVYVEDKLFATLDTRTKKWEPEPSVPVLLSDTIGFVRNIPHHLVASFKATLEEAVNADILIHVIDVSCVDVLKKVESVKNVLSEIGCGDKEVLGVFNKVDVVKDLEPLEILQTMLPDALTISAKTGYGLDELAKVVAEKCKGLQMHLKITAGVCEGKLQGFLRSLGVIINEQYDADKVVFEVKMGENQFISLQKLKIKDIEIEHICTLQGRKFPR